MITIDGSIGEGGGQVLRTALSLSMITREPLTIYNIRAKRRKPGLMRQHLTAVKAAAEICGAAVEGDCAGSTELEFKPGAIRHGTRLFAIGTAGSATLVLQTVLPALLTADGSSRLTLEGGTHNPLAPPFDFLERAFLPLLGRMGARAAVRLERYGFFPAGGGRIIVDIEGSPLKPLSLMSRGGGTALKAACLFSGLPFSIVERESAVLRNRLPQLRGQVAAREVASPGPGNTVVVTAVSESAEGGSISEVFTGFGEKGVSAEKVAEGVAREVLAYLASEAVVAKHLADQLLLPLALAGGGEFTTLAPSLHTTTNIEVIQSFLPARFGVKRIKDDLYMISCG